MQQLHSQTQGFWGVNSFHCLNVTLKENNAKVIVGFNGNLLKGEGAMQCKKCKGVYQK